MEVESISDLLIADVWSEPLRLAIHLVLSFILGVFVSFIYRLTHRGVTFSYSFSVTLIILTIVTTFIIFFIGDSLAKAIGLFGVFSIIRFRTATKDSRDTAFVLYALGSGMAVGIGSVLMGYVGALTIGLLIYLVSRLNVSNAPKTDYILNLTLNTDKSGSNELGRVLKSLTKESTMLNAGSKSKGKVLDLSFNIVMKGKYEISSVVTELEDLSGVTNVTFVSSKNDILY